MAIDKFEKDMNIITPLDDYPNDAQGLTSEELKAKFDEGGLALQMYINDMLLPALIAKNLGFERSDDVPADTVQEAIENLFEQVRQTAVGTIPNGAVTTEKIANASVSQAKLADDVLLMFNGIGLNISQNTEDIDDLMIALAQLSLAVERHIETANGYFATYDARISRTETDAINSAYERSQSALVAEHNGMPMLWHDNNVLTNLLQSKSSVDAFCDLYISDGAGLTAFSGDLTDSTGADVESATYVKIASFSNIPGFGSISKITVRIASGSNNDYLSLELRQGDSVIGTCTFNTTEPSTQIFTVSECPILNPHAQNPVEVWAKRDVGDDDHGISYVTATFVGSSPVSGSFEKAHGAVNGGKIVLIAKYAGSRPVVSCRTNTGEWQTMTAIKTAATRAQDGIACTAASYEAEFAEYATDVAIDIKFELLNAGSKVYDYCAAVVR